MPKTIFIRKNAIVRKKYKKRKTIMIRKKKAPVYKLFKRAHPGGSSMIVPIKAGYTQVVAGTGSIRLDMDKIVTLGNLTTDWFNRYHPIYDWVRINKARIEIIAPYNIGQFGVGGGSLYQIYSKKASSISELVPGNKNEWINMQNAKRSTFSTKSNSVNYYFTPAFEAPQGATTAKRLMWKRWFEMPSGPTQTIDHLGFLASIYKVDETAITTNEKFQVNVTLYCQFKGIKQL